MICDTCVYSGRPTYKSPCSECNMEEGTTICKYEPVPHTPTNADRFRAMSDEELAAEFVFFCPTNSVFRGEPDYEKPHYTGFDGKYYSTSDEVVRANTKWLQQPSEEV